MIRVAASAVLWALSAACLALALRIDRPRRRTEVKRYEVSGISLLEIRDEYMRPMDEAEAHALHARLSFGLVECALARHMRRPAPRQAEA